MLISYFVDKKGRLFEIVKKDGIISVHLIPTENVKMNDDLLVTCEHLENLEEDILTIP